MHVKGYSVQGKENISLLGRRCETGERQPVLSALGLDTSVSRMEEEQV